MTRLAFFDQNAWIALSKGHFDKVKFPNEHAALTKIVEAVKSGSINVPLTFANIYETSKINDPIRRANLAHVQALVSGGCVFRGRRSILRETLAAYIADKLSIHRTVPNNNWFLSDLWFEAAADYAPDTYGLEISSQVIACIRDDPARALFDYLLFNNEEIRKETVRRSSKLSNEFIARIEARRAVTAGASIAMRKRAYGALLIIDELDFILATGRQLGLDRHTIHDVGSSLVRGFTADVPILRIERELAVRLEIRSQNIEENDLRDMASFITVLPYVDLVVAENTFVNLAIQARLGQTFGATLLTSVFEF